MSTSNIEEIIGLLWLILCVLLYIAGAPRWSLWITGILGASSIALAILEAIKTHFK